MGCENNDTNIDRLVSNRQVQFRMTFSAYICDIERAWKRRNAFSFRIDNFLVIYARNPARRHAYWQYNVLFYWIYFEFNMKHYLNNFSTFQSYNEFLIISIKCLSNWSWLMFINYHRNSIEDFSTFSFGNLDWITN